MLPSHLSRKRNKEDTASDNCKSKRMNLNQRNVQQDKFPYFRKPSILGYFDLTGSDRKYSEHMKNLKYLFKHKGRVQFDLNKGLERVIKKEEGKSQEEKLNNVLLWISNNMNKFRLASEDKSKCLNTDFVCYRGLLTKILCSRYENREGWIICATKFRGTIYLFAFDTEQKKRDEQNATQKMKMCTSWGYKFEQYMLADSPELKPQVDCAVNENEEFCCMFRTRLENHSLVFGAEMDGVDTKTNQRLDSTQPDWNTVDFVELKTSRVIENSRQERNFKRYKLIKWWAQSFLVGIPKVICGFRDDYGIVQELVTYDINKLHHMAQGLWDPCVCMNYAKDFLDHIAETVTEDNPHTVWKFEWNPGQDVETTYLGKDSFYQILPEWYIEKMSSSNE